MTKETDIRDIYLTCVNVNGGKMLGVNTFVFLFQALSSTKIIDQARATQRAEMFSAKAIRRSPAVPEQKMLSNLSVSTRA